MHDAIPVIHKIACVRSWLIIRCSSEPVRVFGDFMVELQKLVTRVTRAWKWVSWSRQIGHRRSALKRIFICAWWWGRCAKGISCSTPACEWVWSSTSWNSCRSCIWFYKWIWVWTRPNSATAWPVCKRVLIITVARRWSIEWVWVWSSVWWERVWRWLSSKWSPVVAGATTVEWVASVIIWRTSKSSWVRTIISKTKI